VDAAEEIEQLRQGGHGRWQRCREQMTVSSRPPCRPVSGAEPAVLRVV
jgi:hypothetical protein